MYPPRREDKTMESRLANPLSTAVDLGADALRMGEDLVKDTGKIARNIARKAMGKQHTLVGQVSDAGVLRAGLLLGVHTCTWSCVADGAACEA